MCSVLADLPPPSPSSCSLLPLLSRKMLQTVEESERERQSETDRQKGRQAGRAQTARPSCQVDCCSRSSLLSPPCSPVLLFVCAWSCLVSCLMLCAFCLVSSPALCLLHVHLMFVSLTKCNFRLGKATNMAKTNTHRHTQRCHAQCPHSPSELATFVRHVKPCLLISICKLSTVR